MAPPRAVVKYNVFVKRKKTTTMMMRDTTKIELVVVVVDKIVTGSLGLGGFAAAMVQQEWVVILHPLRGVGRHEEGLLTPRRAIAPRSGPLFKSASADLAVHDEELLPAEESKAPTSAPTTRRGCRLLL